MVKSYTKIFGVLAAATISLYGFNAYADETNNTNFNVRVGEALSVSITTPDEWASGNMNEFLRNKVNVSVTSNNSAGFTATMTTKTANTALTNSTMSSYTLPTLTSNTTRANFPANHWGYSLDDVDAGNNSSTYAALVGAGSTPITLLTSNSATTGSKDFYFGAKADATTASGTYTGTVVINVVSGVIDNTTNPVTPTNPATPAPTDNTAAYTNAPTGNSSQGATTYTYRRSAGTGTTATTTTTTEVSEGDNRSAYTTYTPPQGETYSTVSNISSGALLASGLAATAMTAASSGLFLFIASRKRDEEEDEDEAGQTL